jgi:lipoyl(octanoyl) transferase
VSRGAYLMSLGLVPYTEAFDVQRSLAGAVSQGAIPDTVIFLEHPPVVTVGRRTELDRELHIPEGAEVEIAETDRGGRSTFHGPGQLVCYPILDLRNHGKDVKLYVRNLEEALIRTLAAFGVEGIRLEGLTGVWLMPSAVPGASLASGGGRDSADARPVRQSAVQRRERSVEQGSARREPSAARGGGPPRKIASIGVHVSRWVTTHGYALNVDLDPAPFTEWITACGLEDAAFTTMARELDRPLTTDEVRPAAVEAVAEVFDLDLEELPADDGAGLWPQPIHASLASR